MAARPDPMLREMRVRARLAWNNWEDNATTRAIVDRQEIVDEYSACAWDRVIRALYGEALP